MNILESVIGKQNVASLRTELLTERFELFSYVGKTLLTGKDVSPTFLMRKGAHVIKSLVGHDLVEAEKKGSSERVQILGDFNVAITCNAQLKVRLEGDTDAWRRRLLLVRYEKPKVTKRIPDFAGTLIREEGPGILNWMIEGAKMHLAEMEKSGDFVLTKEQERRIESLLSESDSVRNFIDALVVAAQGQNVTTDELCRGYVEYCEKMGWEGFNQEEFKRKLPDAMREVHNAKCSHDIQRNGKPARGYRNLALVKD